MAGLASAVVPGAKKRAATELSDEPVAVARKDGAYHIKEMNKRYNVHDAADTEDERVTSLFVRVLVQCIPSRARRKSGYRLLVRSAAIACEYRDIIQARISYM
ncbi:hypothetical protein EJB05_45374, partial [Eragrostis curvula]